MANCHITPAAQERSDREETQLLDQLVKLWEDNNERNLKVRQETGRLLNQYFGEPTARHPRGRYVIRQAAERLQISVSEVSRMRWLAHLSKDGESFWGETPVEKRTWTMFKSVLPGIVAATKGGSNEPRVNGSEPRKKTALSSLMQRIKSVTTKLRTDHLNVDEAGREGLIDIIRGLVEATSTATGVRFLVTMEDSTIAA